MLPLLLPWLLSATWPLRTRRNRSSRDEESCWRGCAKGCGDGMGADGGKNTGTCGTVGVGVAALDAAADKAEEQDDTAHDEGGTNG